VADRSSSTSDDGPAAAFARLLEQARADPAVLGFWLGGSRGKDRATVHSDYDVGLVVDEGGVAAWRDRLAALRGFDAWVFTHPAFAVYAAWGGPQAWDRYSFVGVRALIDRTGDIQALIDAKAGIPADAVAAFVDAAVDRLVNQIYRALKCRRDGDALASRLEAAQAPEAFLDALFALNGGRLRPYAKHLAWELARRPLTVGPWTADALLSLLETALGERPLPALQAMLNGLEGPARAAGHGPVLDAWGDALGWIRTASPD
jgi:hypothetical protein